MGPTASGKTDLAIALAKALDGELISVDSALVYRGLDIGSAKPEYPHHLIDICDPGDVYSAARFAKDAVHAIETVRARGRRPILVGGSMLYYHALFRGLAAMPGADGALRAEIAATAAAKGWPEIHRQLAEVDPVSAARIHPNHSQRLSRALEVYRLTGRPLSELHGAEEPAGDARAEPLAIAISPMDRGVLHRRIEQRFATMMAQGFLEEVQTLRGRGDLHKALPAVRAVGYRQLWEYLAGECSLENAQQRAIVATRQLAKRQLTWLRKWPELRWIRTDADGRALHSDLPRGGIKCANEHDPANLVLNYLAYNPM